MIYIVEFPELGRPRSWFAFDTDDFARKVYATAALGGEPLFESREGLWGREALREQLVALEVMEGPQG